MCLWLRLLQHLPQRLPCDGKTHMETMSDAEQKRILGALERMIALTNAGIPPTDALHKVAEADRFPPQYVKRAAEAYNTSLTLARLKSAKGVEKAAEFPLADAAAVMERMWPSASHGKAASLELPEAYRNLLTGNLRQETVNFLKAAEAKPVLPTVAEVFGVVGRAVLPRDVSSQSHRLHDRKLGLEKAAERAKSAYRSAMWDIDCLAREAAEPFKRTGHEPFAGVEKKAHAEYGRLGVLIMDLVHGAGRLAEKRAEASAVRPRAVFDVGRRPYSDISRLVEAFGDALEKGAAAADAEAEFHGFVKANGLEAEYRKHNRLPALLDDILAPGAGDPFAKQAIMDFSTINVDPVGLTQAVGGAVGLGPPDADAAKRKALGEVFNPEHESRMRGIRTQAMLSDFMTNDPVLSGYPSHEVHRAFNDVSQMSPQVADQPAVMRGLLRRLLQQEGVMETHEADQVAKIERQLRGLAPAGDAGGAAPRAA
jgi:hypothetical protein